MTAGAGTLPAGAATEAAPAPASDARPVGGEVGRNAISTALRPGGVVVQGQNQRGDRQHRRGARNVRVRRLDRGHVRAPGRCAAEPSRPRQDPRAEGGRRRENSRGLPPADLTQAARRDIAVPVCLEADNVRGQPTQGAAP